MLTVHLSLTLGTVKRTQKNGKKYELEASLLGIFYQKFMRGTDGMDQIISTYLFDSKCYRYWLRIYIFLFYTALFNSFKYYLFVTNNKMLFLDFLVEVNIKLKTCVFENQLINHALIDQNLIGLIVDRIEINFSLLIGIDDPIGCNFLVDQIIDQIDS